MIQKSLFFFASFFLFSCLQAQNPDPDFILNRVKEKMNLVNDYKADITISINLEMLKIPTKKAVLFYKKPDKIHFDTKGFALIPKKASSFQQNDVLSGKYTAIYVRSEVFEGTPLAVIKVVPFDERADVVLSTLWVDEKNNRIRKIESVTRSEGSIQIHFLYGNMPYDLPRAIQISFEVPKTELPMGITGDFEGGIEMPTAGDGKKEKKSKGSVWVTYENYIVNKGIDDSVFEKKGNKSKAD
ncbi:MAG: hypothetical protein MH137_08205 [Flavobacteriales bacterium]|nr:hypothetical protein [Flavobacteriales bacterium]